MGELYVVDIVLLLCMLGICGLVVSYLVYIIYRNKWSCRNGVGVRRGSGSVVEEEVVHGISRECREVVLDGAVMEAGELAPESGDSEESEERRKGHGPICSFKSLIRPELPKAILLISFLNSFVQSFPINFFGSFLINDIGMSPSQFTQYFAFTFIPFSFKPIYAYIFENISLCGTGRRGYIVLCNVFISLLMFLMASVAREYWQVLLIGFFKNVFEAAASLIVGLVVIDVASKDKTRIPRLQSEQTMMRYLGTFSALILALPVSGCFSDMWNNRTVLLLSAVIPLITACIGLWIPLTNTATTSSNRGSSRSTENDDPPLERDVSTDYVLDEHSDVASDEASSRKRLERNALLLFVPALIFFELVAISVGLRENLKEAGYENIWLALVLATAGMLLLWISGFAFVLRLKGESKMIRVLIHIAIPCLYLFAVDAAPSALEAVLSYKFMVFSDKCQLQAISLLSTVSSIFGMWVYGVLFVGVRTEITVLVTMLLAASFNLFDLFKTSMYESISPFAVWVMVDVTTAFFLAMFLISKEVVATHFSFSPDSHRKKRRDDEPSQAELSESIDLSDRGVYRYGRGGAGGGEAQQQNNSDTQVSFSPGILYSIYLTCFDIGASASGFFSAALVSGVGVSSTDFSRLPTVIIACSIAFLSTAILVPTIRYANKNME